MPVRLRFLVFLAGLLGCWKPSAIFAAGPSGRASPHEEEQLRLSINVDAHRFHDLFWVSDRDDISTTAEQFVEQHSLSNGNDCEGSSDCVVDKIAEAMAALEREYRKTKPAFAPTTFAININNQALYFGTSTYEGIKAQAWDFLFGTNSSLQLDPSYRHPDFPREAKQKMASRVESYMRGAAACAAEPSVCVTLCTVLKGVPKTHLQEWVT